MDLPANDQLEIREGDYWTGCVCGCAAFMILLRDGWHYILCAQCKKDHTMVLWGDNDARC